ncbi:hypothetical protein D3C75_968690 [compost metagenome]
MALPWVSVTARSSVSPALSLCTSARYWNAPAFRTLSAGLTGNCDSVLLRAAICRLWRTCSSFPSTSLAVAAVVVDNCSSIVDCRASDDRL